MITEALILGTGILFLGIALEQQRRADKQSGWPQVKGTIIDSRVELGSGYFAHVEYEFVYDGQRVRSFELRSNQMGYPWSGPARRMIARYPVGTSVTVYVDEKKPYRSVLEPGGDPTYLWFVLAFAIAMLLIVIKLLMS